MKNLKTLKTTYQTSKKTKMKNYNSITTSQNAFKLIALAILLFGNLLFVNAQTPVSWTEVIGAAVNGNTLTKTASGIWNAGAASTEVLTAGQDGYVEITAGQTNHGVMFGFSETNADYFWSSIQYNFYAKENGSLVVYESGSSKLSNGGSYSPGDILRVERIGTTINYLHNGNIIYTSTIPSNSNLVVDCCLYKTNAVLSNAVIDFNFDSSTTVTTDVDDDWSDAGTGAMQTTHSTDKVGIGLTPSYKLDVNGDIRGNWIRTVGAKGLYGQTYGIFFQALSSNYWRMRSNRGLQVRTKNNKSMGTLYHNAGNGFGLLDGDGNWVFRSERDSYLSFSINNNEKMRILTDGRVLIGATTAPVMSTALSESYLFYVNGGGLFKEVKVEADWADYVFEEDYDLTSLEEVAAHIENFGYLHNTPSEEELAENGGIELGNITVNQQEKIEEIFLHLIELNKKVETLEQENAALQLKLGTQN